MKMLSSLRSLSSADLLSQLAALVQWERDGGRCTFVGEDGRQCNETRGLEFAHGEAFAKGGEHSVGNVFLRCRGHNTHEAHRDYGRAFMDRKRSSPRSESVREAIARCGAAYDPRESGWSSASTLVLRRPRGCCGLDSEIHAVRRVKVTQEMGEGRAKLREASASPEARSRKDELGAWRIAGANEEAAGTTSNGGANVRGLLRGARSRYTPHGV